MVCAYMCVLGAQVKDPPNVTWPTEPGAKYSLIMTGLLTRIDTNMLVTCGVLTFAHTVPTHAHTIYKCTELEVLTK